MVRVGAVSSSSWTSLRREQAPPMGRGQASPQGREASTTSSPATTSALSFLTDVIVGAGSSTQPRPSAPSVSSARPANPAPLTPAAPSCAQPSLSYLVARFLLTSPHPHLPLSQASRRHWRDLSSVCRHFAFGSDFEPRGPKESPWRRILRSFA